MFGICPHTCSAKTKLDSKVVKQVFIGYSGEPKAYTFIDPLTGKISVSRDATFHEHKRWDWVNKAEVSTTIELEVEADDDEEENENSQSHVHPEYPELSTVDVDASDATNIRYKSLQEVYDSSSFALIMTDPCSFDEDVQQLDWKRAMDEEIASILKNDT